MDHYNMLVDGGFPVKRAGSLGCGVAFQGYFGLSLNGVIQVVWGDEKARYVFLQQIVTDAQAPDGIGAGGVGDPQGR